MSFLSSFTFTLSHMCFYVFSHIRNFFEVRNFFRITGLFVLVLFNFQGPCAVRFIHFIELFRSATLLLYHTVWRLSRVFSNFFYFLFLNFRSKTEIQKLRFRVVGFLPVPIHSRFSLVFFALVRQLCYNTTTISKCQHLFSIFFPLLQIVLTFYCTSPFSLYLPKLYYSL